MLASAQAQLMQRRPLMRHYPVGASTGYMQDKRGDWAGLVESALAVSSSAVELAALSERELPGLLEFLRDSPELPFRYISVHAPTKQMAMPEAELVDLLSRVPVWVDAIVAHPDVIDDFGKYAPLGRRLLIENMDDRKGAGRTADELTSVFEALPEAGLCFDVAHAWSIDRSMEEGARILDAFRGRLRHVHLSSLDDFSHHVPLRPADEETFAGLLNRCRDVPWILEAAPPDA